MLNVESCVVAAKETEVRLRKIDFPNQKIAVSERNVQKLSGSFGGLVLEDLEKAHAAHVVLLHRREDLGNPGMKAPSASGFEVPRRGKPSSMWKLRSLVKKV